MSSLINSVAEITGEHDREWLELTLAEVLHRLVGAQRVQLWRIEERQKQLRARPSVSVIDGERPRMFEGDADAEQWPRVGDIAGLGDAVAQLSNARVGPTEDGTQVHFFPLVNPQGVCGAIEVEHAALLDAQQEQLVNGLLAIYRNYLNLLDYSEHDTLTGLLNRKTFDRMFARRVAGRATRERPDRNIEIVGSQRSAKPGETPWLAVVDIDLFKRINDRYGHIFGDEVLLLTSRLMRACFRSSDVLFRFGGEEFVILLAPTDADGAHGALERFRSAVETNDFPQVDQVTVSVGYSRALPDENPNAPFERADEALYYAKQNGRNRVCRHEALIEQGQLPVKPSKASDLELF